MRGLLRKISFIIGACCAVSAHADTLPLQEAVHTFFERSTIFLDQSDVDIRLGGRVRHEGFLFDSPLTFRGDYHDNYRFQRAKFNFDIDSTFGTRTYGRSAADARVRLTCFNVWDNYDVYTPIVLEPIALDSKNFVRKAELGEHQHDGLVTNAYLEDGWINLHFAAIANLPLPVDLQCGYFSYPVGRGIALGDYYGGSVSHLGWKEKGDVGNTTQRNPGIMLSIGDPEKCAVQLYYSKWKERSHGPDFTREVTNARRLDRIEDDDISAIQRGYHADHNVFAAKVLYSYGKIGQKSYEVQCEPYAVYVQAPALEVEFKGDASANIYTFGCMSEWKKGGWALNVESAVQMGSHVMHPIDRNHAVYDDGYYIQSATQFNDVTPMLSAQSGRLDVKTGSVRKYHSHVLLGITDQFDGDGAPELSQGEFIPYRAYYVEDEIDHINAHRGAAFQGAKIVRGAARKRNDDTDKSAGMIYQSKKAPGEEGVMLNDAAMSSYTFRSGIEEYDDLFGLLSIRPHGTLYNANIPFGAGRRFRPRYELDCRGYMAMADLSYTFSDRSLTLAIAGAHISGDDYPFNDEKDKTYTGFIPFRDANYEGRVVKSYAVLAARKIARPSTFSDNLMYAPNDFGGTNLQYLGIGSIWRPCQDRECVRVESNAIYFWQDKPPFAWDVHASRDFGSSKLNGIWAKAQDDLHFTGYQTSERASKRLGLELNAVVTWRPVKNLELRALLATFLPGKLYKDIEGTPNAYTVRVDADGEVHLDSLSHRVPFGCMVRLTYFF